MPKNKQRINFFNEMLRLQRVRGFRAHTVKATIRSIERYMHAPKSEKRAHPMSNHATLLFRYKKMQQALNKQQLRTIITHHSPHKSPKRMQPKTGRLSENPMEGLFTPTKKYEESPDYMQIYTGGGHVDKIQAVQPVNQEGTNASRKKLSFHSADLKTHEVTVQLTYRHLVKPTKGEVINNRRSHDSESADEKMTKVMQAFFKKLVSEKLMTEDEMKGALENHAHYEYTHAIAGHWGVLTEAITGNKIDPAAGTSSFVAPAAFNTEMILMERFADFLVFINHKRHGMAAGEPSVQYTFRYNKDPETQAMGFAELIIKDLRIDPERPNIPGTQCTYHWENPMDHTEKPLEEQFELWLRFLKKAWARELTDELVPVQTSSASSSRLLLLSNSNNNNNNNEPTSPPSKKIQPVRPK